MTDALAHPGVRGPGPVPGHGKAQASLVLGIIGAVLGILMVPLLCSVAAVALASLSFQEMDAGGVTRASPGSGRGMAVAGLVLGIVAMAVWIPVVVAAAILSEA